MSNQRTIRRYMKATKSSQRKKLNKRSTRKYRKMKQKLEATKARIKAKYW